MDCICSLPWQMSPSCLISVSMSKQLQAIIYREYNGKCTVNAIILVSPYFSDLCFKDRAILSLLNMIM